MKNKFEKGDRVLVRNNKDEKWRHGEYITYLNGAFDTPHVVDVDKEGIEYFTQCELENN
jgi:hypothetical protein